MTVGGGKRWLADCVHLELELTDTRPFASGMAHPLPRPVALERERDRSKLLVALRDEPQAALREARDVLRA